MEKFVVSYKSWLMFAAIATVYVPTPWIILWLSRCEVKLDFETNLLSVKSGWGGWGLSGVLK